jgi:phosphocarrier protein
LHARPAALFVKTASRFESDITVEKDGNTVSGKSIMGLMTLEAGLGSVLTVTAEGVDAEEALNELQNLVESKFYED